MPREQELEGVMASTAEIPESDPEPLVEAFKAGMRALAHGVTVIATGEGGARNGFTATSVVSLSAEPPSLLFCVGRTSSAQALLHAGALVSVNVLSGVQENIADRFAGRGGHKGAARFAEGLWSQTAGEPPTLEDAIVSFICGIEETIDRHSHTIVIARVAAVRSQGESSALVYAQGGYDRLGWTAQEARAAVGLAPEAWPIRRDNDASPIPFKIHNRRV
jgi:flavin reductase (DIM6/NTAB) family NADH-FMN oxidoreductase RutF